jgi:TonB family protein
MIGVLLGGVGPLYLHREVKASWTVGFSLLLHALLFSVVMLALQKPISHPLLIQSYPVSLVSLKPAVINRQEKLIPREESPPVPPEPHLEMAPPPIQPTVQSAPKEAPVEKQMKPDPIPKLPPAAPPPADLPKAKPIEDIRLQNALPDLFKEKKQPAPTFFKLPPLPPPTPTHVPETGRKETEAVVSTNTVSIDHARIGGQTGSSAPVEPLSKYPYYFSGVKSKIDAEWSPPPIPRTSFGSGDAVALVRFIIKRDGHINKKSIQIEKSSGNNFFDAAALRAVYNADPLLPLPYGITEELYIHFEFKLSLGS